MVSVSWPSDMNCNPQNCIPTHGVSLLRMLCPSHPTRACLVPNLCPTPCGHASITPPNPGINKIQGNKITNTAIINGHEKGKAKN